MLLLLLACRPEPDNRKPAPEDTAPDTQQDTGADSADSAAPCAESAGGTVDAGAHDWQQWDDGDPRYTVADFGSINDLSGDEHDLSATPGYEAVRFEFAHPAEVYALTVQYGQLPETDGAEAPVSIGIYADFGYNGFDFAREAPLWTGTRCLSKAQEGEPVTFRVDPPLVMERPGLLYAASWREGDAGPMVAMDAGTAGDGTCGDWDECHSSIHYPEIDGQNYHTGTVFPIPYDLGIAMQYAYTSEVAEADMWFHEAEAGLPASGNISWGDYDDDGDEDIMLAGPSLWRNDGGTFTDVSAEAGVQTGVSTTGGVWGDYDNDGCLDFFGMSGSRALDESGRELLLHSNCDGTFSDVTLLSGIDDLQGDVDCLAEGTPQHSPTYGTAWADFDNDGRLDLVLANFLCFDDYTFYPDRFWHNEGDGLFSEWGTEHGFERDQLAGRGVVALDADMDGDIDISINNYVLQPNLYYENLGPDGDGQWMFSEEGSGRGLAGDWSAGGYFGHTIGMAWGDLDGDGDWDSVHANLAHPRYYAFSDRTQILLQDEYGEWENYADTNGIAYHETHSNPSLLDIENDGDLDLTITEVYSGRPTDLYVNDGSAVFTQSIEQGGIRTENGWGSAVADYDNDGDADLMIGTLYRNDRADGHWIKLRLVGDVASNRAAIGAVARVEAGGQTYIGFVSGGNGVGNQDAQTLLFGLGTAATVDAVEVWFPGGETVRYTGLDVDQGWRLYESGAALEGTGAPPG